MNLNNKKAELISTSPDEDQRSKSFIKILVTVNGKLLEEWGEDSHPTHSRIYHIINELKKFNDIEIIYIGFRQMQRTSLSNRIYNNIIKSEVALRYLWKIVKNNPFVYFEYPYSMTVLQNRIIFRICVLLGIKTILDVHDTWEQSKAIGNGVSALSRETERYCFQNATLISFSLNPAMWMRLAGIYDISGEKRVVYVPNAFEESFMENHLQAYRNVEGRFNICYIGGLSKNRGVDILVRACSSLHDRYPFLRLYLLGEYSEGFSEEIINIIEKSDFITRRVVKRKDLSGMIKDMDLFVMPYNPEINYTNLCSPTKYFEYVATGRPILSTKCKSVLDLADGGVIYSDYNVKDFEEKIETLMTDIGLREKLSAEQESQRYSHTWQERAKRIHDALIEI
jgi:glycosyltransferase involved in cell wall biosynthesis